MGKTAWQTEMCASDAMGIRNGKEVALRSSDSRETEQVCSPGNRTG